MPKTPDVVYWREWQGWADFLGYGRPPFAEARRFARTLGLKDKIGWDVYCRTRGLPPGIPHAPNTVYAADWYGWPDFLGYTARRGMPPRDWLSFEKARTFARSLELNSFSQWRAHYRRCGLPPKVPKAPYRVYAKEWRGWQDWLGVRRQSFAEARRFARSLGLKSSREWTIHWRKHKLPRGVLRWPQHSYATEWRGWPDFLGMRR